MSSSLLMVVVKACLRAGEHREELEEGVDRMCESFGDECEDDREKGSSRNAKANEGDAGTRGVAELVSGIEAERRGRSGGRFASSVTLGVVRQDMVRLRGSCPWNSVEEVVLAEVIML